MAQTKALVPSMLIGPLAAAKCNNLRYSQVSGVVEGMPGSYIFELLMFAYGGRTTHRVHRYLSKADRFGGSPSRSRS